MKKSLSARLLALLVLCCLFSSCAREERFGYSELNLRLKRVSPSLAFEEEKLFLSDRVWYAFYEKDGRTSMLLTMREDDEGKLDRLTLALGEKDAAGDFMLLASALAKIFIPGADTAAIDAATGFLQTAAVFGNGVEVWREGFYSFSLWASPDTPVVVLEYDDG